MQFNIRDLLWLTTVVCLALGWGMWIRSLPPPDPLLKGNVYMDGNPVTNCRICFHSKGGEIYGSTIVDGKFAVPKIPAGTYQVSLDGEGMPARYGLNSELSASVKPGRNTFDFDLRGK